MEVLAGWDGSHEYPKIDFTTCKTPQSTHQSKSKTTKKCCSASTEKTYPALLQLKALNSCMSHKHHLLECSIFSRDWVLAAYFPPCHDTSARRAHAAFIMFTFLPLRKSWCLDAVLAAPADVFLLCWLKEAVLRVWHCTLASGASQSAWGWVAEGTKGQV